jgi:hypothetical protein
MTLLALLALAAALLIAAALWFETGQQRPQAAQALGLAVFVLAIGAYLSGLTPPTPIPPEPPTGSDFGGYRPHFQGFGSDTIGGRGGPVCHARDYGSLVACVQARQGCADTPQTCARVVVFDQSGIYDGQGGQITITSPYLTIAGQTAPSGTEGNCSSECGNAGGVTLANTRFLIDTHDVVVQHLKIRRPPRQLNGCSVGDAGDGGRNDHVHHVIYDHVTCTWADEVNNYLAAGPGSHDIMLADSLVAEGLWPNAWGGIGAGVAQDSTIVRNLFSQHYSRQPIWGSPTHTIVANNVSYNGTDNTYGADTLPAFFGDADGDATGGSEETVILNNVMIPGPNSGGVRALVGFSKKSESVQSSRLYLSGNTGPGLSGEGDGQWQATVCGTYGNYSNAATCGPGSNLRSNSPFGWFSSLNFVAIPTSAVRDSVLANAGARPRDRDAADLRIVDDVVNGTGTHFLDWNSIQNLGGMPTLAVRTRTCNPPSDPNGAGIRTLTDGSRNTRLEDWLESDGSCGAQRLEVKPAVFSRSR